MRKILTVAVTLALTTACGPSHGGKDLEDSGPDDFAQVLIHEGTVDVTHWVNGDQDVEGLEVTLDGESETFGDPNCIRVDFDEEGPEPNFEVLVGHLVEPYSEWCPEGFECYAVYDVDQGEPDAHNPAACGVGSPH